MDYYSGYTESDLLPGDCLLYKPKGFFGWVIAVKTYHMIGHCETYIGNGRSVASRDGVGVGEYPLRLDGLVLVLRPNIPPFNITKAIAWYEKKAKGQKYDWKGLLRFVSRKPYSGIVSEDESFCSEFLTRFYRMGDLPVFYLLDADAIAPFMFASEGLFKLIIPGMQVTGAR